MKPSFFWTAVLLVFGLFSTPGKATTVDFTWSGIQATTGTTGVGTGSFSFIGLNTLSAPADLTGFSFNFSTTAPGAMPVYESDSLASLLEFSTVIQNGLPYGLTLVTNNFEIISGPSAMESSGFTGGFGDSGVVGPVVFSSPTPEPAALPLFAIGLISLLSATARLKCAGKIPDAYTPHKELARTKWNSSFRT